MALGGAAAGLAVSPLAEGIAGITVDLALGACLIALALTRPAAGARAVPWLVLLGLAGTAAGLLVGAARLRSIDAGASRAPPGAELAVRGYVAAVPRRSDGMVRFRIDAPGGRLSVEAPEPLPELPVGAEVEAAGGVSLPLRWLRENLRLHGVARVLHASRVELTGRRRGGIEGRIDAIRSRAEDALGRGMPDEQAALARGFVLGQDDRISPPTIEAFQRSGLAHLLAVSGQNVLLLVLLAAPLLAALGIPLRARLAWLLALIAVYVPLAGAGPSIQRAGVMGAAAAVATLAGRPASRIYALLLAVVATLALNPRASSDVGWQLSFSAVVGIFVLAAPLRDLVRTRIGEGGWRTALADGVAVTVSATLATAPLMAHHFEALSATSLVANVLALPAVAPAMWLGMVVAALGQAPGIPVEPLNWLNSLFLAYIGQVAEWMGSPRWALLELPVASWTGVLTVYAGLLAAALGLRSWVAGREGLSAASRPWLRRARHLAIAALVALALGAASGFGGRGASAAPPAGLRVSVLDVGQGDSILIQPADAPPVLVDGGPPGEDLRGTLADMGIESLAAAVVTHDQSDHAGGIRELLGSVPVRRLVFADAGRRLLVAARAAGAIPTQVASGSEVRSGSLRLEVLWPPRELLDVAPAQDPNARSLVLLAHWRNFEMLLTGDTEAELAPIDPGQLDVLKVAHHGSDDAGLAALLDRTVPRLAVISVGEDNPFGHPTPSTLATLAAHDVPVLRTDLVGTVTIEVGSQAAKVRAVR